jgi:hypothetical protein
MKCKPYRRLFGPYWDDETTRAEREWIESHFAVCAACRADYEAFARVLETAGSLPRLEASPDLVERVLSRSRRLSPAPDRVRGTTPGWLPVAAAATAMLAIVAVLAAPWVGVHPSRLAPVAARLEPVRQPALRSAPRKIEGEADRAVAGTRANLSASRTADVPDSLFDHSEDVEFILDPVTLRHGRASVSRAPSRVPDARGQQATITF